MSVNENLNNTVAYNRIQSIDTQRDTMKWNGLYIRIIGADTGEFKGSHEKFQVPALGNPRKMKEFTKIEKTLGILSSQIRLYLV